MKRIVMTLALWLMAAFAFSQTGIRDGQAFVEYDVDSTTLTYCVLSGQAHQGGPWDSSPIMVAPFIKTTGASTTVTAVTAGTNPFKDVVVGDVLVIYTQNPPLATTSAYRVVTAKATADSITVDATITLAGNSFGYVHNKCGTTAEDGWFSLTPGIESLTMTIYFEQGDITNLVARWECRHNGMFNFPMVVYPGESSDCGLGGTLSTDRCSWAAAVAGTATGTLSVRLEHHPGYGQCRVGVAYTGADPSDAGANLEKVTVKIAEH